MKPIASLSLDLDNLWSYMKTHGDAGWESYPSYLDTVVPRFVDFFEQRMTSITVFIVGQDAALSCNRESLAHVAQSGHEIGNHSFKHEPWLHLYSVDDLNREIGSSQEAIQRSTGETPIGFRGPGFSCTDDVLRVLSQHQFLYDASTFPTFMGPLARLYYFFSSKLSTAEKKERKQLFGKFTDGFRPNKPFQWEIDDRSLLEIPVTTMPFFKTPIHVSYLLYLARFSKLAAKTYFAMAMQLCRLTRTQPSLLLHPLDFMDIHDAPQLSFFPAIEMPHQTKMELLAGYLDRMERYYTLSPMRSHADACQQSEIGLRRVELAKVAAS